MQFLETFCAPAAISVLDPKGFGTEEVDDLTAASVYALMVCRLQPRLVVWFLNIKLGDLGFRGVSHKTLDH